MLPSTVEPIFDFQFRLILIGDSTVGKSSLLRYFTDGKFAELCDPTVGVDFFARLVEVRPGIRSDSGIYKVNDDNFYINSINYNNINVTTTTTTLT